MASEDPTWRDRVAYHEAGHALAGTLIYGSGFVVKIRIRLDRQYGETATNFQTMGPRPKNLWHDGALVELFEPDAFHAMEAAGLQALAGMAAGRLAHGLLQPGIDDVEKLNHLIRALDYPAQVLEPTQESFAASLLSNDPYRGWFESGTALLSGRRASLDSIASWLMKTDTLQGQEVEDLISGRTIREGEA